jgi:hypothetical protein
MSPFPSVLKEQRQPRGVSVFGSLPQTCFSTQQQQQPHHHDVVIIIDQ